MLRQSFQACPNILGRLMALQAALRLPSQEDLERRVYQDLQ